MNESVKRKLSLGEQTAISTIGLTMQFFAQWLISILLVRMSDYKDAGVFSLAMSVSNVFAYFANYGMRSYLITDTRRQFSEQQYFIARFSVTVISLVSCIIYLLFSDGYTGYEATAVFLYLLYNSINNISDIMQGVIQLKGHLEVTGISNALRGILCFIAFTVAFTLSGKMIPSLGIMVVATLLITIVYDMPIYLRYRSTTSCINMISRESFMKIRDILVICFPLMLSQILPIITTAIPRRAIHFFFGEEMLGVYSSIFAPTAVILTLIPAIVTAMLPKIASDWQEREKRRFKKDLYTGVLAVCALLCITTIAVFLLGKWGLRFLFGESILPYYPLLYWAVYIAVISGSTAFFNGLLTTMRKTKVIAYIGIVPLLFILLFCVTGAVKDGIYTIARIQLFVYCSQAFLQIIYIMLAIRRETRQ